MVAPDLKRTIASLIALLCLLFPLSAAAAFQALVDRNPVAEGESLTLTLKSNEDLDGDPDLSVLQKDFDVLGQSQGSSMQIINGKISRSIQWQISIMPKRSGSLVIPAIKAGNETTQPITLRVTRADQAKADRQSRELFLEVSAQPRTAYVQQQIIFTVRLYRVVNIGDQSTLSDPKFPNMDAMVERLGDDRSFQTMRNGQAYAVIERRYALYPQRSGQFSSAPVQFDGTIVESNPGGGFFMFDPFSQRTRHKRVTSGTIPFTIKPMPAGISGAQWLPASQLQLTEQWSQNPPKFTAGEPVTRTVVISAKGLTASQLPVLDSRVIDGLKFYPDQPALKDNKGDNGNNGVRTQKIAILPTRPGSFILPAIEVKWWNVNTDRMEVARLPARTIAVLPGAASSGSTNPPPGLVPGTATEKTAEPEIAAAGKSTLAGSLVDSRHAGGWWPWLSLSLAAGWLATLILWWRARNKIASPEAETGNAESLRQLENQLQKCCISNDAKQAKSRLLAWAKLRWPQNPPTSLTALAAHCQADLASALNELDRVLYANGKSDWHGENLLQSFNRHKPDSSAAQASKRESLEPLFLASR